MTNVTLFNKANVPAFAKNREGLSSVAKALAGNNVDTTKRISIKGGVFRLYSGGKEIASIEERYLDVVFVAAAPEIGRVFYAKAYDGEVSAPDCWSADGKTPSIDAGNKQHSSCKDCPQNIAGSGLGNSRACRYQQRVAVVLANDMEGDILQLTLPAKSIFGDGEGENRPLQAYIKWLMAQQEPIDPSLVVTRLKFDTKSESPKLFFKEMRWLNEDEYETISVKAESAEAKRAVAMTMPKQTTVSAPAPLAIAGKRPVAVEETEEEEPPAPPPKAKKAKAAPVAEEESEEPTVRKEEKKPSSVPVKKSNLAAMVDDWEEN
jgi:hypothetical protein